MQNRTKQSNKLSHVRFYYSTHFIVHPHVSLGTV